MDYQQAPNVKQKSYYYESEEAIDNIWSDRKEERIIPLLMGGEMVINYISPEEIESPWDDNDHNGPQAA